MRAHFKNTYNTANAVKGMRIKKAIAYLEDVLEHKQIIGYTKHLAQRHAQCKMVGTNTGRWPEKSVKACRQLLLNLKANLETKGLDTDKCVITHVAVQRAQQLMDIEIAKTKDKLTWKHWKKVKAQDMSDEYSDWVPRNILYFNSFIEDLFNTKTKDEAFELIDQASAFLKSLEGARLQGGPVAYANKDLFDWSEKTAKQIDFSNPDDDNLRNLEENGFDN